jgi:hypothetical protein
VRGARIIELDIDIYYRCIERCNDIQIYIFIIYLCVYDGRKEGQGTSSIS